MIVLVLLLFLVVALVAFFIVIHIRYQQFSRLGIPGPRPMFPFGNSTSSFLRQRNVVYDVDDVYR